MLQLRFGSAGLVQSDVDMPACIAANMHTSVTLENYSCACVTFQSGNYLRNKIINSY